MSENETQERRGSGTSDLIERLHNPTQLRLFLMAAVLGVGYAVIYLPLTNSTDAATKKLRLSQKRLALAEEVGQLRKQFHRVEERLTKQPDSNEWVQYVLAGIRRSPLKLESFTPQESLSLGPFKIVVVQIKIAGSFADLDSFLHWIESNQRLFRVDKLKFVPNAQNTSDDMSMDISLLGLMG